MLPAATTTWSSAEAEVWRVGIWHVLLPRRDEQERIFIAPGLRRALLKAAKLQLMYCSPGTNDEPPLIVLMRICVAPVSTHLVKARVGVRSAAGNRPRLQRRLDLVHAH